MAVHIKIWFILYMYIHFFLINLLVLVYISGCGNTGYASKASMQNDNANSKTVVFVSYKNKDNLSN